MRDGGKKRSLDLGGVIHARRHAMRQQIQQEGRVFPGGGRLDQLDQRGGLLRVQRQRRDAEGGAFGGVLSVGLQHGGLLEGSVSYFMSYIRLAKEKLLAAVGVGSGRRGTLLRSCPPAAASRPRLLLYFATQSAPPARSGTGMAVRRLHESCMSRQG